MFEFKILHQDKSSKARTGAFVTPHGTLHTPEFAIVATDGNVKAVTPEQIPHTPIEYTVVNTFHIFTKGILEDIQKVNGIHNFMCLNKPTLSDSGGFQVFSLGFGKSQGVGKIASIFPGKEQASADSDNPVTITDDGVSFSFDNREIVLTPESSMDIQHKIGADIICAFDECTSPLNSKRYTEEALERTHSWIIRCIKAHKDFQDKQALFGIVQGGEYEDLRKKSARYFAQLPVPGFGIGGSLGKTKKDMHQILTWTIELLPQEKPRHLLGIGQIRDIFDGVEHGVDLFDCVIPTREARHKVLYTDKGKFPIRKLKRENGLLNYDFSMYSLEKTVSYAQLADMFMEKNPVAYTYATLHNIHFFTDLMKSIRQSIENNTFSQLKERVLSYY